MQPLDVLNDILIVPSRSVGTAQKRSDRGIRVAELQGIHSERRELAVFLQRSDGAGGQYPIVRDVLDPIGQRDHGLRVSIHIRRMSHSLPLEHPLCGFNGFVLLLLLCRLIDLRRDLVKSLLLPKACTTKSVMLVSGRVTMESESCIDLAWELFAPVAGIPALKNEAKPI